ncbi:Chemotaxis MotB protein [Candidatus Terasakiella magnetica]|uniref:Chemotaxis MotB protein n=1 Tax=Candidatus Terasakiella magnetica TaxID=1867952 RepID=A0A1C3RKV9_9PROT|nr:flagellar motor protein MotB [Candidatus Terasakiella magnetica]SCA57893.1 Chemotaxis MotB protein [Candidatus Terasakiella magnetica]
MRRQTRQVGLTSFVTKTQDEGKKGAWMVTFTDLVSLLLTFFVMLFSMATVQIDKWDAITDSLSTTLNPQKTQTVATATADYNISTVFRKRAINLEYLQAVLAEKVEKDDILGRSMIQLLDDRLLISLPGDLLFTSGSKNLSTRSQETMLKIGDVLRHVSNQIVITGHTDPQPSEGQDYASNWELSLFRAIAVGNALRKSGFTQEFLAYGYGDSGYDQLPAIPDEQKAALARRVDIMVLQTGVLK